MKRVALDFDGVIHDYSGGWQGFESIPGGLCPGIAEGIRALNAAGYKVAIISSRARDAKGYKAIVAWLYAHGIDADEEIEMITCEKEPAMAYIDDRAICYRPGMDLLEAVRGFTPWMNEKPIESALE